MSAFKQQIGRSASCQQFAQGNLVGKHHVNFPKTEISCSTFLAMLPVVAEKTSSRSQHRTFLACREVPGGEVVAMHVCGLTRMSR
jgi:hypothetical protein